MKTFLSKAAPPRRSGTWLPLISCFFVILSASAQSAAPVVAAGTAPKDHALFVGSTLFVLTDGASHQVVGAEGDDLMVDVKGKIQAMPQLKVAELRVDSGLKLSNIIAQIDELKGEPTKRVDRSTRNWQQQQITMMELHSRSVDSTIASARGMQAANSIIASAQNATDPGAGFRMAAGQQALAGATADFGTSTAETLTYNHLAAVSGDANGPDALELSCLVSSPKAAAEAFLLMVVEYRARGQDGLQYRVHAEPLAGIGPKAQRVRFVQTGFPAGFQLEKYTAHIYAGGQEVATNLSERRVDLTADDALRYLSLCYIASHSKESLPAVPLQVRIPADFKHFAPAAALEQPLYVTIGTDGLVRKVAVNEVGDAAPDAYIDSVVRKFRFNPALDLGKPVESVLQFKLNEYLR